ncbi:hypothetical protein MTYP_01807 [Methylophilaceae bacterium]|nr:hypothetical protein MTYP_01807 [Methylophilaceae bacterium]
MAKENGGRQSQLRQLIAQQAARLMADEGVSDYGYAKRKAGRQLGITEDHCMPTNAEVEEEIKLFHEIYNSAGQAEALQQLRADAVIVMQMLERFNPYLTGAVLDGTAGRYAATDIHLYADSLKDVEMFLLNQQVPYETNEKTYRKNGDKKDSERKKVPVFTLEGPNGLIRLSVFDTDDERNPPKSASKGTLSNKANLRSLMTLLESSKPLETGNTAGV